MLATVNWINEYLDRPASAEEQADLLTRAGFPLEGTETVAIPSGSDVCQDFEMTSNRGDCTCHIGLAREIAAISGRALKLPEVALEPIAEPASERAAVVNEDVTGCPLYTGRVIRNVTVGPSPQWLQDRLIARGEIPRNNVVDATNFVLFELGQPTHVFDLDLLKGSKIIVRRARDAEPFVPLGEGAEAVKLVADDLVIADAERAVALAGVKGGAATAVTDKTTNLLLEAATFDRVTVRTTSRRHGIASDSSYRFERGVHPATVNAAADRLAALILEVAGGELLDGVVSAGAPIPAPPEVSMRPAQARALLGVEIGDETQAGFLERLGFAPRLEGERLHCTVPPHRMDIEREVDLIEEVGRMYGLDAIPVDDTIAIRVAPLQPTERAHAAVADLLVGLGFLETVTHSLVGERAADAFMPPGLSALRVDDERARAEPVLRPSILPSLLTVYAHNHDHGSGAVRLFESASTFARREQEHVEASNLAFVLPAPDVEPLRETRGIVERLVRQLRGPSATVTVESMDQIPWFTTGAVVRYEGEILGTYGVLSKKACAELGVDDTICACEIGLPRLYDVYPPETEAHALPAFPAIERDLSIVIADAVTFGAIESVITELALPALEAIEYVTVYRGKGVDPGQRSLTLRLRFRLDDRTLTHDEVDERIARAVDALSRQVGAGIRT